MTLIEKKSDDIKARRNAMKQAAGVVGITLAMAVPAMATIGPVDEHDTGEIIRKAQKNAFEAQALDTGKNDVARKLTQKLTQWNNWPNWNNWRNG